MKEESPLVSILCLTYNHSKYIRETLDSFLSQDADFLFEIIVHDDASTDNTQEIIKEYQKKHPKIIRTILQNENQRSKGGNVFANAYDISRGKYIAYCEGDDYWGDTRKLAIQVGFLENNPRYVMTYSDCVPVFEDGVNIRKINAATCDLTSKQLKHAPPIHSLTVCFRRVLEIPKELGFVEYGDLFLWSLLADYGDGKYINNFEPCRYRVHNGGIHSLKSRHRKYEMIVITFALMARYYRRIGDLDAANQFRKKIIIETLKYIIKGIPGSKILISYLKRRD